MYIKIGRIRRRVRVYMLPFAMIVLILVIIYLTSRTRSARPVDEMNSLTPIYTNPPLHQDEFVNNLSVDIDFNKERVFKIGQPVKRFSIIPKIIHLIWTDEIIPTVFVNYVKSFRTKNPYWKIYFWTYAKGRDFIKKYYPDLVKVFDGYGVAVSRADALRYMLMHRYGGAYFDIDTECLSSLDVVADTNECILSPEPIENAVMVMNRRSLLSSSGLMCTPKHAFFKYVIDQLPHSAKVRHIMYAAGPAFISITFNAFITHYINTFVNWNGNIGIVSYKLFEDHMDENTTVHLLARCYKYTSLLQNILRKCTEEGNGHVVTDIIFTYEQEESNHACTSPLPDKVDKKELDACKTWFLRGGIAIPRSNKKDAIAHHIHFGTYRQESQLISLKENNIINIIPDVHMYPCLPEEGSPC